MWQTQEGVRKLDGAERRLFVLSLLGQLDYLPHVEEGLEADVLNQIPQEDRPYVFLLVAETLLDDEPPRPLRAWNEAAIWEIYQQAVSDLEMELMGEKVRPTKASSFTRQAILDAFKERFPKEKAPAATSSRKGRWTDALALLSDEILWDEDFLMYEDFADKAPDRVAKTIQAVGIQQDYFADAPPFIDQDTRNHLDSFRKRLLEESNGWLENYEKSGRLV